MWVSPTTDVYIRMYTSGHVWTSAYVVHWQCVHDLTNNQKEMVTVKMKVTLNTHGLSKCHQFGRAPTPLWLFSLIANSMLLATGTWGSCLASEARSTGGGCVHGPKITPAIPSTSLPSWDIRRAWPTRWERCTALPSVCKHWWMQDFRQSVIYLVYSMHYFRDVNRNWKLNKIKWYRKNKLGIAQAAFKLLVLKTESCFDFVLRLNLKCIPSRLFCFAYFYLFITFCLLAACFTDLNLSVFLAGSASFCLPQSNQSEKKLRRWPSSRLRLSLWWVLWDTSKRSVVCAPWKPSLLSTWVTSASADFIKTGTRVWSFKALLCIEVIDPHIRSCHTVVPSICAELFCVSGIRARRRPSLSMLRSGRTRQARSSLTKTSMPWRSTVQSSGLLFTHR